LISLNFDTIKRNLWYYPSIYTKLRQFKKIITASSLKHGIEKRPEFAQIQQILYDPTNKQLLKKNGYGPKVLCFSLRGAWTTHIAWETVIALGLRLRGARVDFFTCGGVLPACGMGQLERPPCISCYHYLLGFIQPFGFPMKVAPRIDTNSEVQNVLKSIETTSWQDVYNYKYNGLNLGQIVLTMVRWYLRRGNLIEDEQTLRVYHTFLKSCVLITEICQSLLSKNTYDVIFCLNGEFFAEAIIHHLAKKKGIRIVTYERGYQPDSLFFRHDAPACKYVIDQYWERTASVPLTSDQNLHLDEYLTERCQGIKGFGRLRFWPKIEQDEAVIRDVLGLDMNKPIAVLFTNTNFDSTTQNLDVAFKDMFHWIKTTIDYFSTHPQWQLVIRVHPSEIRYKGREAQEPVARWIEATFPNLSANIKIVPPESTLSSYTLMRMSRVGLVYTSTSGMEMSLMGKPVIVAGKPHYRGKGFTDDPVSSQDYIEILKSRLSVENTLNNNQLEIARRYAYLFFFRTMIPFNLVSEPKQGEVVLNFNSLSHLLLGHNRELDVICNGILSGEDFLL
jgi:hypothetical protein